MTRPLERTTCARVRLAALAATLVSMALAHAGYAAPTPQRLAVSREATALDSKLDAGARLVLDRWYESLAAPARAMIGGRASSPGIESMIRSTSPFSVMASENGGPPDVLVLVRLGDPAEAPALAAAGAIAMAQVEDIVAARVSLANLERLAALPEVRSIEISKRREALLDSSRARSHVKEVQAGAGGLPAPYLGDGVIVGVLDSGLDYTHQDFRTADNHSRVVALYDFSQGTNGAECRQGQLDSLTCPEKDGQGAHGHGTHVTGITSGNGRLNGAYVGMAPNAEIMFVKGIRDADSNGGFSDNDVIAGTQFIFDKAYGRGQSAVVNLSLGGQFGPHDGTTLYEQSLSKLTGPGRIIVAAAGNNGQDPVHCGYNAGGTDYTSGIETAFTAGDPEAAVDIWYPPGVSASVGIAVYQGGVTPGVPQLVTNAAPPGQVIQGTIMLNGTGIARATIDARTTSDANNGAHNVLVILDQLPGGPSLSNHVWSVYTYGSGAIDMWAVEGDAFLPAGFGLPPRFRVGDSFETITIPATARRLIAVGSHVTKTHWIDVNGANEAFGTPGVLDQISWFSSKGPSRDGRVLPDLSAPGQAVASALSKDYTPTPDLEVFGGGYQIQQGTSQASPHVAGVVALMLERNGYLTPENARQILQQSAVPAGTGNPNNVYGAGRLNALAALLATPDAGPCLVITPPGTQGTYQPCQQALPKPGTLTVRPNPARGATTLGFVLGVRQAVHLAIYDLQGRRVRTLLDGAVNAGYREEVWDGRDEHGLPAASGIYFVRLRTPTLATTTRMVRIP